MGMNEVRNLWRQKRYQDAHAAIDAILRVQSTSNPSEYAKVLNEKGFIFYAEEKYQDALAYFEKAIAQTPQNKRYWKNKGNCLSRLNRYQDAHAALDHALVLDPHYEEAFYSKALVFHLEGQSQYALSYLEKMMKPADSWVEKPGETTLEALKAKIKSQSYTTLNLSNVRLFTTFLTKQLEGPTRIISSIIQTPDGTIISAGHEKNVYLWQPDLSEPVQIQLSETDAFSLAFIAPSWLAVAVGKKIEIWDLKTRQFQKNLMGHTDRVTALSTLENGWLASGSDDKTIRIWDPLSGACLKTLSGHTDLVRSIAALSKNRLASFGYDKTIRIWDGVTGQCLHSLTGHTQGANFNLLVSLPGGLLASGSNDQSIRIWNPDTGECLHVLQGHPAVVWSMSGLPNGLLISGDHGGHIQIWDPKRGELLHSIRIPNVASVGAILGISPTQFVFGPGQGVTDHYHLRFYDIGQRSLDLNEFKQILANLLTYRSSLQACIFPKIALDDETTTKLCQFIQTQPNLREVDLSELSLTREQASQLIEAGAKNVSVTSLKFNTTCLNASQVDKLNQILSQNQFDANEPTANSDRWQVNSQQETLLHWAAKNDRESEALFLAKQLPDEQLKWLVQLKAQNQQTLIHLIAEKNLLKLANALFNHDERPNSLIELSVDDLQSKNQLQKRPIDIAAERGHRELVDLLLKEGVSHLEVKGLEKFDRSAILAQQLRSLSALQVKTNRANKEHLEKTQSSIARSNQMAEKLVQVATQSDANREGLVETTVQTMKNTDQVTNLMNVIEFQQYYIQHLLSYLKDLYDTLGKPIPSAQSLPQASMPGLQMLGFFNQPNELSNANSNPSLKMEEKPKP